MVRMSAKTRLCLLLAATAALVLGLVVDTIDLSPILVGVLAVTNAMAVVTFGVPFVLNATKPRSSTGRILLTHFRGQWYATRLDYDITGAGPTKADAVRESDELVCVYVEADGVRRPVPLTARLRLRLRHQ